MNYLFKFDFLKNMNFYPKWKFAPNDSNQDEFRAEQVLTYKAIRRYIRSKFTKDESENRGTLELICMYITYL